MMRVRAIIVLAFFAMACGDRDASKSANQDAPGTSSLADTALRVQVDTLPARLTIARTITGSYATTPEMLADLNRYVETLGIPTTAPIGVFPMDPDTAPAHRMTWDIVMPIAKRPSSIAAPYRVAQLEGATVARINTTVARSHRDGKRGKEWVIRNGYVQTAPTRVVFLGVSGAGPSRDAVTILFPIRMREGRADAAQLAGERARR
jgi:hypothetical protein